MRWPIPLLLSTVVTVGACCSLVPTAAASPTADKVHSRWALLVGVDDYSEIRKLRFAGNDQRAMAEQLIASGFPEDQVFLLHDKAENKKYLPFRANIEKQLELVLGTVSPGDLVIVGFSGHGVQLDGKSYLCPEDTQIDKLATTMIPLESVYERLAKCRASLKLLMVDACRNDILPAGRRSVVLSRSLSEFDGVKEQPPEGILLLSSCGPGQASMEDEQFGHGVFIYYMLEGLKGKAANAEGGVSLTGLYDYASLQTKKYVARKFNDYQTPALKGEINGPFEICSLSLSRSKSEPATPPTPTPREVTAEFTVRLEEKGPLAAGAQVELVYTAASGLPLTLGRALTDSSGLAKITAALTVAQQKSGGFDAVVSLGGARKEWGMREFPRDVQYEIWVPRPTPTPMPVSKPSPGGQPRTITNSIGMKLALIPAGEFQMGNSHTAEEEVELLKQYGYDLKPENFKAEYPRHRVRLTKPFYLGAYQVTRGQFRQFVEAADYKTDAEKDGKGGYGTDSEGNWIQNPEYTWQNTGFEQTDEHPVVNVSWNDAAAFCEWLSRKESKTYRLPTEAQWEYACRAGSTTRYYNGDDPEKVVKVGNVADSTARAKFPDWKYTIKASDGYLFTSPVGQFRPNAFGLYDMHGNVFQWCLDWYGAEYYANSPVDDPAGPDSGSLRVGRGGGWISHAGGCRSANRSNFRPEIRYNNLGLRVLLVAE